MIIVALGNFGDLVIQSSFISQIKHLNPKVVVSHKLRKIGQSLCPDLEVFELSEQYDLRYVYDRNSFTQYIKTFLIERFPSDEILNFTLSIEQVFDRGANLYQQYGNLWKQLLKETAIPTEFPYLPFKNEYPLTVSSIMKKKIIICPVGGIEIKSISSTSIKSMAEYLQTHGYKTEILLGCFDDEKPYLNTGLIIHKTDQFDVINSIHSVLNNSSLVISTDTVYYHLSSVFGFKTLGVPGPRSANHFQTPNHPLSRVMTERLACANCFSTSVCEVTYRVECMARPSTQSILSEVAMLLNLPNPVAVVDLQKASFSLSRKSLALSNFRVNMYEGIKSIALNVGTNARVRKALGYFFKKAKAARAKQIKIKHKLFSLKQAFS